MILMAICGLLLLAGLVGVVRWGGHEIEPADADESPHRASPAVVARRYLRSVTLAVVVGNLGCR